MYPPGRHGVAARRERARVRAHRARRGHDHHGRAHHVAAAAGPATRLPDDHHDRRLRRRQPPQRRASARPASTTAIGDSVLVGAAQALATRMGPRSRSTPRSGRQLADAADLVAAMAAEARWAGWSCSTSAPTARSSAGQIDALFAAAGPDRTVLLVNVSCPGGGRAEVNDQLAAAAGRHPNAVLVDWRSLAAAEPGLFRDDGFHVTPPAPSATPT